MGGGVALSRAVEPDYARVHIELRRKGVTLMLLWGEYCAAHEGQRTWVGLHPVLRSLQGVRQDAQAFDAPAAPRCAAAQPDWLRQGFLRRGRHAMTLPTGWRHDHSP